MSADEHVSAVFKSFAPDSRGAGVSSREGEVCEAGLFLDLDEFLGFVIGVVLVVDFRKEPIGFCSLDGRSPLGAVVSLVVVGASF
jgi:hypothetical protein